MAVFEDSGGRYPEGGAEDPGQMGRVREAGAMSGFGQRGATRRVLHGGEEALPAEITLDRHPHLLAPKVTESARRQMHPAGQLVDGAVVVDQELGGHQRPGGGDPWVRPDVLLRRLEDTVDQRHQERVVDLPVGELLGGSQQMRSELGHQIGGQFGCFRARFEA